MTVHDSHYLLMKGHDLRFDFSTLCSHRLDDLVRQLSKSDKGKGDTAHQS